METSKNVDEVTEIESLCMNCNENGTTKLMLTNIPHFKGKNKIILKFTEIVIASFECPHCGYENRDVRSAATLSESGSCCITLVLKNLADLNRQVVKSDNAKLTLLELELEIPSTTQQGICNTVEGILKEIIRGLGQDQIIRKSIDIKNYDKICEIINKLEDYATGKSFPFTLKLEDPSGNSLIESLSKPGTPDPQITVKNYKRTKKELEELGYDTKIDTSSKLLIDHLPKQLKLSGWDLNVPIEENVAKIGTTQDKDETISFNVFCPNCGYEGKNEMCTIDIPGFRSCLIMAFICTNCGTRSTEVKAMGAYGDKAKRWTLNVQDADDLNRDVLKSDTAALSIPELELELSIGTLGGIFTTIEGLVLKIADSLENSRNIFAGDSVDQSRRETFENLLNKLRQMVSNSSFIPFTLIIDDAADLSMIAQINGDQDFRLKIEEYDRTEEQMDDLGLTDMKTENY